MHITVAPCQTLVTGNFFDFLLKNKNIKNLTITLINTIKLQLNFVVKVKTTKIKLSFMG